MMTLSKTYFRLFFAICFIFTTGTVSAQKKEKEDKIELRTTKIKGNKELPKILYVVPWRDAKSKGENEQKLKLHNLFGDLYSPVVPESNALKRPEN